MHMLSNPSPSSSSRSRAQLHSTKVGKGHEPDNLKIPVHDSASLSAKSGVGIACSPPFCDRWVPAESARFGEGVCGGDACRLWPRGEMFSLSVSRLTRLLARSALLSTLLLSRLRPERFPPGCSQLGPARSASRRTILDLAQTRPPFELRLRNSNHIPSEFEILRVSDLWCVSKIPCVRESVVGRKFPLLPDGGSQGAARSRWGTRIGEESGGHTNAVGAVFTSKFCSFYLKA